MTKIKAHNFCPPFIVIRMPYNANGEGPETDETKVYSCVYEVWDNACQTVAIAKSEKIAHLLRLIFSHLFK